MKKFGLYLLSLIIPCSLAYMYISKDTRNLVSINDHEMDFAVEKKEKIVDIENNDVERILVPPMEESKNSSNRILVSENNSFEIPQFENKDAESKFMKNLLLTNTEFIQSDLENTGYSEIGAMNFVSGDVVSIEDMPIELREVSRKDLQNLEERGYWEVSELFADEITGVTNYIIGTEHGNANIDFTVSETPDYIKNNYEYLGFTHPNYSTNPGVSDLQNGTLRRVFSRHDTSSILILEESSNSESGRVVLTAEYVNTSVGNQPAIFQTKKSESGNTFASLHWTTDTHSYNLYQIGSLDSASDNLFPAAIELTQN